MAEFSDYKISSDGKKVRVFLDEGMQEIPIFEETLSKLLKGERLIKSDVETKTTLIFKLAKSGKTFVLSIGKWGDYLKHEDGEAVYEETDWQNLIIGTKKFQAIKKKVSVETVFYSF